MNRKTLLAFLGTSSYRLCTYKMPSGETYVTNFVLSAIASSLCKNWKESDIIYIFTTQEAKEKNWNNLINNDGTIKKGLNEVLIDLNLPARHEAVIIPEIVTEKKIWDTFRIIFERLNENDEIYIDITHGFRASPLLLMTLLNYSSFLKETFVRGIFYGADQAKVLENGVEITPVWNLNDIALLNEWTSGALEYINFGDPRRIKKLAEKSALPGFRSGSEDERNSALRILDLSKSIVKVSVNLATVRGFNICSSKEAANAVDISKSIEKEDLVPPFSPFMEKIRQKIDKFKPENDLNFLYAVKYCIDHNLIQQGITFMQEGIVTYILKKFGFRFTAIDSNEKKEIIRNRENVSKALHYISFRKAKRCNPYTGKGLNSRKILKL
ncbi:MAG: TIGR02221 family CRISPR-associated protein, partial [Bacteroidales bacterium]|nr:TIGR02221 family CRISPR-associated protein [Bacteroidales bacterium]